MSSSEEIKGGVHKTTSHDSARKHVNGAAIFIDDMPSFPDTQEAALLLSPYAHAKILEIDITQALASLGVSAVITAKGIPGKNDIAPVFSDEPVLASQIVEYAGQPIVAISADSYDNAFAAIKKVKVVYEELIPVLTIQEAWDKEQFTYEPAKVETGNAVEAIKAADFVLNGEVSCGGQDHFYLESQIALAIPEEDQAMLVYSSTQHPTEVQHGVSNVLGIPQNDVTVEVRRMGGGFGGKESQSTIIAAIAALLAEHCRTPVKVRLRRDVDMIATGKRHDFLFKYQVGFNEAGEIGGAIIDMAARSGNVADLSAGVLGRALCHADNAYFIPNALFRAWPCKTNTVSNTAFRGFGSPQGMLVIETIIEHIAHELKRPVEDIRSINWYGEKNRNVTPYGQTVTDNIMAQIVDRLEVEGHLHERRMAIEEYNRTHKTLKKGIALMPVKFGISFNAVPLNQAGALVHVYTDGSVHLNHGGTEMGQGLFTKVAQVVSSVFQIDIDHVKISSTRTDKVPNTGPTAASAGSDLNGMAAFNAAEEIKGRMKQVAASHFGVETDSIEFRQNRVYAGNESLKFSEVAELTWSSRISLSATGYYQTPDIHWDGKSMSGSPFYYYTYGASISEVVIDTLTGESRVLATDILQDVGSSLNPGIDLGQIEGAFVQGLGWLTSEELVWDQDGRLMTHGPSTYKIPGSRDVPPRFKVHILEDTPNTVPTIYRSKAVGEPPLMLALSVWLAIRDAVARTRDYKVFPKLNAPATPEAILMALDAM
ncbi:MAG: xanthine dehydrogenase molybdopterin binding subunit [Rhodospirillales bacterium]|nr:xanthine dehydrogenase molybdopterin binding subunit [Rhodospirillales bacterium]